MGFTEKGGTSKPCSAFTRASPSLVPTCGLLHSLLLALLAFTATRIVVESTVGPCCTVHPRCLPWQGIEKTSVQCLCHSRLPLSSIQAVALLCVPCHVHTPPPHLCGARHHPQHQRGAGMAGGGGLLHPGVCAGHGGEAVSHGLPRLHPQPHERFLCNSHYFNVCGLGGHRVAVAGAAVFKAPAALPHCV